MRAGRLIRVATINEWDWINPAMIVRLDWESSGRISIVFVNGDVVITDWYDPEKLAFAIELAEG